MIRRVIVVFGALLLLVGSLSAMSIDPIVKSARELHSITCFVTATAFSRGRKSVIQYEFAFKRDGQKMRIEYVNPRNMRGTKIAIDGEYFYSYIANLHRTTKRRINPNSSKNPGREMGLFFYYMKGNFEDMIAGMNLRYIGSGSVSVMGRNGEESVRADHFSFSKGNDREELWFDTSTHVPVKVKRFVRGKLALEIDVTEVRVNPYLEDSTFRIKD